MAEEIKQPENHYHCTECGTRLNEIYETEKYGAILKIYVCSNCYEIYTQRLDLQGILLKMTVKRDK